MEEGIALAKFSGMGEESGGEDSDAEASEGEATRARVTEQNRKGKKSGGFQSMGRWLNLLERVGTAIWYSI